MRPRGERRLGHALIMCRRIKNKPLTISKFASSFRNQIACDHRASVVLSMFCYVWSDNFDES